LFKKFTIINKITERPCVWVLGDAVVDLIPDKDPNFLLKCPGGAPANVAVGVSRLEGLSKFIGKVGKDPLGAFIKKTLENEGVGTEYLILDPNQRTSTVVVDLDPISGDPSFTFMVRPSADQFLTREDIPVDKFNCGDFFHFCSIALANQPARDATFHAVRSMKARGGYISFDPNIREEVWQNPNEISDVILEAMALADVVKMSRSELNFVAGDTQTDISFAVEKLLTKVSSWYPEKTSLVLITDGENGTHTFFTNGEYETVPTQSVKVVDATGAGDAFMAGFLNSAVTFGNINNVGKDTVLECVRFGNICGRSCVMAKGAMTALPRKNQLT